VRRTFKSVLQARARLLARPLSRSQGSGETVEVVEFRLAAELYGIEQVHVREVYPLKDLTPLPCTPAFVQGSLTCAGKFFR